MPAALLALLALLAPPAAGPAGSRLAVAAAANLRPVLEELARTYEEEHPGASIRPTYGASGRLLAQIEAGAPFDLFLSADAEYPAAAEARGLSAGRPFTWATARLAAWVPAGSVLDLEGKGLAALRDPGVRRIAIANPAVAPTGRAAEAALRAAGVLEEVRGRLVLGESAAQVAHFLASGNAQAGLLPLSLAAAAPLDRLGRHWEVPPAAYPRLEQAGVVLRSARSPDLAADFAAFLRGPRVRALLGKFGYGEPGP